MTNTHSSHPQDNPESELTLGDVLAFVIKAKWFALAGIVIGAVVASTYLASIPAVYQSSITIQIQTSNGANANVTPSELLERFTLSKALAQVISLMKPAIRANDQTAVVDSMKTATLSKTGNFMTFSIKTNSADEAQKLATQIAIGVIAYIDLLNEPKITQLQKTLSLKKSLLASANKVTDTSNLQASILELELTLSSQENLKPLIVDGPTVSDSPVSPKPKPALLLGILLGLALGLGLSYLKQAFAKNRPRSAHPSIQ